MSAASEFYILTYTTNYACTIHCDVQQSNYVDTSEGAHSLPGFFLKQTVLK
jgi:hypothetical protein